MNQKPQGDMVTLSLSEMVHALMAVSFRIATSGAAGLNHASVYQRGMLKRIEEEFVGVCGEMAFAKMLNEFRIPALNEFHDSPDVGRFEVRATRRDDGSLIIRDNDPDDRWFVLVTGEPPVMRIAGWMQAKDAKRMEWLRDPGGHRPSWFVPQSALRTDRRAAA